MHLTKKQLADLQGFDYEGNVRELVNLLERAMVLAESDFAKVIAEYREMNAGLFADDEKKAATPEETPVRLDDAMRLHVRRIYEANGSNITVAARVLGVAPNTVKKHLGRMHIGLVKRRSSNFDNGSLKFDG